MIKLLLSGFFLFITSMTNAAIVQPTELADSPIRLLDQKQMIIKNSTQTQREAGQAVADILYLNTQTNVLVQQENSQQSNLTRFKSFAKKLKNEYGDNELVQESLSTLYEAKQLWDVADSQANTFASDIIFSLKLDKLIENDLINTQQSLQNSSTSVLSRKDSNFSSQGDNFNNISWYSIQKTQTNSYSLDLHKLNNNLLSKLFRITTVYYLIALFILITILQWAIKFALRFFP